MTRNDKSISAVIPFATTDYDFSSGPVTGNDLRASPSGVFHQDHTGESVLFNRPLINLTELKFTEGPHD